mgnify:FL=1
MALGVLQHVFSVDFGESAKQISEAIAKANIKYEPMAFPLFKLMGNIATNAAVHFLRPWGRCCLGLTADHRVTGKSEYQKMPTVDVIEAAWYGSLAAPGCSRHVLLHLDPPNLVAALRSKVGGDLPRRVFDAVAADELTGAPRWSSTWPCASSTSVKIL